MSDQQQMKSEIADLSQQMEAMENPRDCYALVRERIQRYKQKGGSVPEELERLERSLLTECLSESQGR